MLAKVRPVILCLLVSVGCAPADPNPTLPDAMSDPPPTRRDNVVDVLHGVEIVDPYRWLEDQDSSETGAWIGDQNACTSSHLGDHPRRGALAARLSELMRIDQVAAPRQRGGRYFLWKKQAAADLWVLYLRQGLEGEDEVLIDPHTLSAGQDARLTATIRGLDNKVLRFYQQIFGESWEWQRDYVYRESSLLAAVEQGDSGEATVHFHLDHLGTPRQITDASGVEVAFHSYYPFGGEATERGTGKSL